MKAKLLLSMVASTVIVASFTGCGTEVTDGKDGTDGVTTTITDLYTPASSNFRTPIQSANDQMLIAEGLTVKYLTREVANHADMGAFYPYGSTTPTHFITCVEGATEEINATTGKLNPSVQSINLSTGEVITHLRGMQRCDGARTTPWGTVLATEEDTTGGAYEIIDIMNVTNHQVTNRSAGTIADGIGSSTASTKVVKRTAMPTMAWEGLEILKSGVVIGGDELRPGGASADVDGGAIFKFVPTTLRTGDANITNLSDSPLVAGKAYALRVWASSSQYGQGAEVGYASWVEINASDARASANANDATGYYRPEDLHLDPTYTDENNADAIRFCWANTGNEGASFYGEVMCAIDTAPTTAAVTTKSVVVDRFIEGDKDFNSVDNLAFQPTSGNLYVIEDHTNGDIFACLPDGNDRDLKTDGCVRLLSVKDQSAEPTGFAFHPNGTEAYLFIQHSDDTGLALVDDYRTDDMIKITGFGTAVQTGFGAFSDFGKSTQEELHRNSRELFGFGSPLIDSSSY